MISRAAELFQEAHERQRIGQLEEAIDLYCESINP